MNRIIKLLLVVFVFVALSCNLSSGSSPTSTPSTVNPESPIAPTSPVESQILPTDLSQTQPPEPKENNCDGYKWTFHPAAVYRYPQDNGFDKVIVDFAFHNGSDKYWGEASLSSSWVYITTEDGYQYHPFSEYFHNVPADPPSPYSGRTYTALAIYTPRIPPGFTTVGFPYYEETDRLVRNTFGFDVASSQKSLTIHLTAAVSCKEIFKPPRGDTLPEMSYSLDDLANYPLPTSEDYPELGSEPIIVPDIGTFVYTGLSEQDGKYALQFSFTNANGGYATKGNILVYLVGDDGLFRPSESYSDFEAGPAQTIDLNPFLFTKPTGVNNLKFVFEDPVNGVYAVYDFVPTP